MVDKSPSESPLVTTPYDASWSIAQSLELYGVRDWGEGYFDISAAGELVAQLPLGEQASQVAHAFPTCTGKHT